MQRKIRDVLLRTVGSMFAVALATIPDDLDRTDVYEKLYSTQKYHSSLTITHATEIIRRRVAVQYPNATVRRSKRVLDVGCSHGFGVSMLWSKGFHASGMDLSTTAVNLAIRNRKKPEQTVAGDDPCDGHACFKQGSAAAIPWPNASFDAIMTTDVLEHVPEPLLPTVVAEFTRVAVEALFMAISVVAERVKFGNATLHETVRKGSWWKAAFEASNHWRCRHSYPECPAVSHCARHAAEIAWVQCERVT